MAGVLFSIIDFLGYFLVGLKVPAKISHLFGKKNRSSKAAGYLGNFLFRQVT